MTRTSNGREVNGAQVWLGNVMEYVYHHKPLKRAASFRDVLAKAGPRGIRQNC